MGSISAWLPSRRSTLHHMGGAVITRPGHVRSAMSMGLKGRYLSEGVRNMVRFSLGKGREQIEQPAGRQGPRLGFVLCPVLLAPTVSAWGLLRLGAQKQKRERKQRPGAVLLGRCHLRAERHGSTLTS